MSVQSLIENKLVAALAPRFIEVVNESGNHNVPPGSESHFKVTVVSEVFDGKSRIARHRAVNGILADELAGPVHALAIHPYAPGEWSGPEAVPDSPDCHGGSGR